MEAFQVDALFVGACKEVSCFAPLALALLTGHRIYCYLRAGMQATTSTSLIF